jgi:hypothetical protein
MRLVHRGLLWRQLVAVVLAVGGLGALGATPLRADSPTFMTIQLAHTENSLVDSACNPLSNVVTLEQQAAAYQAMGITGVTGTVITDWMSQSTLQCRGPYQMASWDEMVGLQRDYGWSFVSGSQHGDDLTQLSPDAAKAEMCQSGLIISGEGLNHAWGEFAFPHDQTNAQLEQLAISCGYGFGRVYGGNAATVPVAAPYWLNTFTVNGGACHDHSQPCYLLPSRFSYTDPAALASRGLLNPSHWRVVQGYAFVTGAVTSDTVSWDCTSPNWYDHWTSGGDATEVYCWNDWLTALATWRNLQYVTPGDLRHQRQGM